jgi:hypothetical protein
MADAARKLENHAPERGSQSLTSSQTAQYTREMLDSLREIAARQREDMLVRLLEAAAIEARRIATRESAA